MAQTNKDQASTPEEAKLMHQLATQDLPQDASKLIGRVNHDKLCDTVHEKVLNIDGEKDEDLFTIPAADYEIPQPRRRAE